MNEDKGFWAILHGIAIAFGIVFGAILGVLGAVFSGSGEEPNSRFDRPQRHMPIGPRNKGVYEVKNIFAKKE